LRAVAAPVISPAAVFSAGNHASLLDNSGQPHFDPGFLNHFNPDGTQVAAMLATGANGDPITDSDLGAVDGIAVVWADNANGVRRFLARSRGGAGCGAVRKQLKTPL